MALVSEYDPDLVAGRRCGACRFWVVEDYCRGEKPGTLAHHVSAETTSGQCHRRAPIVGPNPSGAESSVWPYTRAINGCGEFEVVT
jgi:hypothetical protein